MLFLCTVQYSCVSDRYPNICTPFAEANVSQLLAQPEQLVIDLVNQTASTATLNALLDFHAGKVRKDVILLVDESTRNIDSIAQFYRFEVVPTETRETQFDPALRMNTIVKLSQSSRVLANVLPKRFVQKSITKPVYENSKFGQFGVIYAHFGEEKQLAGCMIVLGFDFSLYSPDFQQFLVNLRQFESTQLKYKKMPGFATIDQKARLRYPEQYAFAEKEYEQYRNYPERLKFMDHDPYVEQRAKDLIAHEERKKAERLDRDGY